MNVLEHYASQLDDLKKQGNLRQFTANIQMGRDIQINNRSMLNLSSNDYLGLAVDERIREEFFDLTCISERRMSSSSSRLLTGNFPEYEQLEQALSQLFGHRAALLFNSGYHMNIGILPALCDSKTLILADKLVHASLIDGMRLSTAQYVRYRHNDLNHLDALLKKYQADQTFERIIIVTESIFSMDGDEADLAALVALKKQYSNVMLYVDEAHAIGVRGKQGLGIVEQAAVIQEVDFIVGTFGKALASVGAYLICDPIIRDFLINKMRPLIFSTAQPPICMAWTNFILQKVVKMNDQREYLKALSHSLNTQILAKNYDCPSSSQIVPVIVGDSIQTVALAHEMQKAGFYIMPVRPPTVPQGASRLRICLNTRIDQHDLDRLVSLL
ncbi:MAG: 8-amino-7-oxononanoate synthase [Acinetobacter sp.]|nr:8-amino-7-oxononanoate synthase [Acinetobacter sp.]